MNEELKVIISAEIGKLKEELKKGQKEVEKVGDTAKKTEGKFGKAMAAIGKAAVAGMKVVAGAIAAGVTALVGLAEATSEYRTAQAKLTTAFESAGASAEQAKQTYNELYRVLGDGDVAVEAANHLAKLTTNEQELAQWTTICEGVYATFGDSLPIEGLTEAANETAKTGSLTGSLADALNWAGISEEEFQKKLDKCNTEAEREALIRETLNGIYSEAAANYEKNAAALLRANEAEARMTAALGELGKIVEPIVTEFKIMAATFLESLVPGLTLVSEGLKNITGVFNELGAEQLSEGLTLMFESALTTITDMLPTMLDVGIQIVMALIQGLITAIPSVVNTIMGLIPTVVNAVLGLLPQLITLGIQLISSILSGIAQTIPQIVKAIVDLIPAMCDAVIEGIPLLLEAAIELLMAIVNAIPEILPNLIDALPMIIENIINCLINNIPMLIEAATSLFLGIVDAIPEILPRLAESLPQIIATIVEGIIKATPQILAAAVQAFIAIPMALLQTIPELINALSQYVKNVKEKLVEKLKNIMKFEWKLPKLKLPSVSITGKFSLSPLEVPKFSIKWNRLGGVFDNPTIFGFGNSLQGLGEDGAEAVVPLEKNTQWMNVLAGRLSELMGAQSTPIVLQVDGKTFAQTSINTINQLTRQTGSLGLTLT